MAEASHVVAVPLAPARSVGSGIGRFHWTLLAGAGFFAIVCALLILTPWIAPYDPAAQDLLNRIAPPSSEHIFGTDHLGRDVLSRLLHGGRFSVSIAAVAVLITGVSGTLIGAVSARVGGLLDDFLMRLVDALLAFPEVLIALFLVFVLGPGYGTLIIALAITGWTPFARLTRAVTLEINTRGYIEAAEALGCSKMFIIVRHVLPNAIGPVLAQGFLRYGHQLITVGALSYLGLGVQKPQSDWGAMLSEAQLYMIRAPWLVIVPGLAIFLTALSVTLAGHGLRQSLRRGGPRGLGAIAAAKARG